MGTPGSWNVRWLELHAPMMDAQQRHIDALFPEATKDDLVADGVSIIPRMTLTAEDTSLNGNAWLQN